MQQTAFGSEGANWPGTRQDVVAMTRLPMSEPTPITRQPGVGVHATTPSAPPGGWQMPNTTSQLGLESLIHYDKIFIDQHLEELEVFTNLHGKNKYTIKTASGQPLFHMREDSSLFSRMCCGSSRDFNITVFDNSGREVFRLESPTSFICRDMNVYVDNSLIGTISKGCSLFGAQVEIRNPRGQPLFQIEGPCCPCACFSSFDYQVFTADRSRQIGAITREWPGLARQVFTNADVFGLSFPRDLNVHQKTLLIGATILLDFAYHEDQ